MAAKEENPLVSDALFVGLVAAFAVLFLLATVLPDRAKNNMLQDKKTALEQSIITLDRKHQRLLAEKDALKYDPMYVEYVLRLRGFKRPGEKLY